MRIDCKILPNKKKRKKGRECRCTKRTLLGNPTDILVTLRNNKKFLPKDIPHCKLRKGEMVSKENDNGIVVLKWRNTRDVRILSTKHAPIMVASTKKS